MSRLRFPRGFSLTSALLCFVSCTFISCTTPYPGYRHEYESPDARLHDILDERAQRFEDSEEEPWYEQRGEGLVDPASSMNELRELHLEHPDHVPTLFALASLEYESGAKGRASGYLDALFDVRPVHSEAGILRSRMALDDGNLPASRRVLDQQIRYRPDHSGLREARSATAYLQGDLATARAELEIARRLGAPYWRVAYHLGLIEEAAGNRTQAIKAYEVALMERPDFPEAESRLAGLRALFGDVVR